jgi:glucose/arabinose dehydrogenase
LVWDAKGRLWATEHGRSGVQSGLDELNAIEKGRNYGWPTVQGDETEVGMTAPAVHSGPWDTWAPADAAYREGSVYFGGLRGEALYQAAVEEDEIIVKAHFEKEFGRIRVVAFGPDRYLYVATSNTDGRGLLRDGDDKIIRINPRLLP